MAKKIELVKLENVRINKDLPSATVKFKPLDAAAHVVRVTSRGLKPLFVKMAEKGWTAGVRGEAPVHARTPGQAFARAARQHWA